MLIKKSRLVSLIREAMLNEITLSGEPYSFTAPDEKSLNVQGERRNPFKSTYNYKFDSSDKEGNVVFNYIVTIGIAMNTSGQPFWDVMFSASPAGDEDAGDVMQLTGQNDMRVYTTVAHILKDFVLNILDKLPDSDVRVFGFSGIKEAMHDAGDSRADTHRDMSRRTAVYLKLLQRNITRMLPGSQVLQSFDENTVYFRVP